MCSLNSPDLKHRDWLLATTVKMVQNIDSFIRWKIISLPNGTKHLVLSNISEDSLGKINFLTNTDQNNNYLYLEDINVFIDGNFNNRIEVTGLKELAIELYNNSDQLAFLSNSQTHVPFNNPLLYPFTNKPMSLNTYIDLVTSAVPFNPNTVGHVKTYSLILNPDDLITCTDVGEGSICY